MNNETEKNFYSREELKEFETLINKKLEEAKKECQSLASNLKAMAEGSADNANFIEFGADSTEKEYTEMQLARQKKFIRNLENALIRIANGTYGRCKNTGKLIPKERLRIVPHTTTTVEGKMMQYTRKRSRRR